jgi:1-deoxy-D-xylulose-5-phosphate reductoisomerase
LPSKKIEVLIHPQSVIHSMVAYVDGSVLAQLGVPDMRTPIAYCLAYPKRMAAPVAQLDLAEIGQLTFEAPDSEQFPALRLARQALEAGGSVPIVLNAANEVAVKGFLEGRGRFLQIAETVERTLEAMPGQPLENLEMVFAVDREARARAQEILKNTFAYAT